MAHIITPYVVLCFVTAFISIFIAALAWQHRAVPGGTPLIFLMLAIAIWSGGSSLEYTTIGIPNKLLWAKIEYFGVVSCPVFYLIFALEYNHFYNLLTRRNTLLLFIPPFITLILAFTNEWHGLIWTTITASPAGQNLAIYNHGLWFWIGAVGYSYLLNLTATVLLIWAAVHFPTEYRRQSWAIVIGAAIPWVANIVYITGQSPIPGLEFTPIILAITGIIFAWSILRFQLLNLVPVARDYLIETLNDGLLVLDVHDRLVDINPAARQLIPALENIHLGQPAIEVFANFPALLDLINNIIDASIEIPITADNQKYVELSISLIKDQRGHFTGRMVVARDISERKLAEQALRDQMQEIRTLQTHLREQAIRDPLTGLFNRRFLDENFERLLKRAARDQAPVSVVMLDLDHFKKFNDTYGHQLGDEVLHTLGNILLNQTRAGDIACRYGGEEFIIIMPNASSGVAFHRAEQWRGAFQEITYNYNGQPVGSATLSGGIAVFPRHGANVYEILHAADEALYFAKTSGRDHIEIKH